MKSTAIFLLQLFLGFSVMLFGLPTAWAALSPNQEVQAVQALEETLYTIHYDKEPLNSRVNRLEETVFGQAQTSATLDARINKLQGSLSPKALGPLSSQAKAVTEQSLSKSQASLGEKTLSEKSSSKSKAQTSSSPAVPETNLQKVASASGLSNKFGSTNAKSQQDTGGPSRVSHAEPGETDYPTVSQMELKTFGKTFEKEELTQRLDRLEKQVFKIPQTGSLADRSDNLRLVILGDTAAPQGQPGMANSYNANPAGYPMQNDPYSGGNSGGVSYGYPQSPAYGNPLQPGYGGNNPYTQVPNNTIASASPGTYGSGSYGYPGGMSPMPGYGGNVGASQPTGSQVGNMAPGAAPPDMSAAMDEVEKQVLGSTHSSDPLNTRLDRVETKVFKATSPEMSPQDRIQRVIAVASAGGTPANGKTKAKNTMQVILPFILTILPLVLL